MVEGKQSRPRGGSRPAATDGGTEGRTHLKRSCGLDYLAFSARRVRAGVGFLCFVRA